MFGIIALEEFICFVDIAVVKGTLLNSGSSEQYN